MLNLHPERPAGVRGTHGSWFLTRRTQRRRGTLYCARRSVEVKMSWHVLRAVRCRRYRGTIYSSSLWLIKDDYLALVRIAPAVDSRDDHKHRWADRRGELGRSVLR